MHPRSTIDRYVADGLPDEDERSLRAHLKSCSECRDYYDAQRVLFRAVAGDAQAPTPDELRLHSRLAAKTVFPDQPAARERTTLRDLFERFFWAPSRAWGFGAAAAAAAILLVVVLTRQGEGGEGDRAMPLAGTIAHVEGATVDGQPLVQGRELRALEVVDVPKGGIVEVNLVRGGLVRVFPETRLALGARGESVVLHTGKVWCLPEEGKGGFEVTTSTATVRVLGTSFIVDTDEEKTDVRVVGGSVEVTDTEERGRVRLQKEESTRVEQGRAPTTPRRASTTSDTQQWQRVFDQLGQAVRKGIESLESLGKQLKKQQGSRQ